MRIIFLGTGDIGLPTLHWLATSLEIDLVAVGCQPDRPAGRSRTLKPSEIKTQAISYGIPVFQPEKIRSPQVLADIAALKPDIILVMAYGQILPKALLDIPTMGCLNLHASLLPRHRGASPIQAAIAEGDEESGITVIWMDEGLDTGDILLKLPMRLSVDETASTLHNKLALLAREATRDTFNLLSKANPPCYPQPSERATYAGRLTRDTAHLDWQLPAKVLERRIRAYDPWPSAWAEVHWPDGKVQTIKVHQSEIDLLHPANPGYIYFLPEGKWGIGTVEGLLVPKKVTLQGRREMPAIDFRRGHPQLNHAIFK